MMLAGSFAAPAIAGDILWVTVPPQAKDKTDDMATMAPVEQSTSPVAATDTPSEELQPTQSPKIQDDQTDGAETIIASQVAAEWTYPVLPGELMSDYVRLVNADNLLEANYVPDDLIKLSVKKTSSTAIQMRKAASSALDKMFQDALDAGITLYAHSGYRAYQTQKTMYYNRLEKNNGVDDGYVTKPGASDHQTGLGIDVISKAWINKYFNSEFAKTDEAKWMAKFCADYGFIIRYPEGKEDITQIAYEPWHLRYVGLTAARYITDNGLTLEEFAQEWPPILQAFIDAGGDVSTIVSQVVQAPDGSLVVMPKQVTMGVYRTDVKGPDGDYEYSLFDQEDTGDDS